MNPPDSSGRGQAQRQRRVIRRIGRPAVGLFANSARYAAKHIFRLAFGERVACRDLCIPQEVVCILIADTRNIAVVAQQRLLKLPDVRADLSGQNPPVHGDGCRRADRLPADGAGRHHARRGKRHVRRADDAPTQEQIGDIPGIIATIRNRVHVLKPQPHSRIVAVVEEALDRVHVHRPSAIGHGIRKAPAARAVRLVEHIIAQQSAALALARQHTDPFQLHVLRAVFTTVLDVIPHAVHRLEQLVAQGFRVGDGVVPSAAQLNPPVAGGHVLVNPAPQVVLCVGVCPVRLDEGHGMPRVARLEHERIAHRAMIRLLRRMRLIVG